MNPVDFAEKCVQSKDLEDADRDRDDFWNSREGAELKIWQFYGVSHVES